MQEPQKPAVGAGLFEHAADDPFPRAAGVVIGLLGLVFTLVLLGTLLALNPAVGQGRAGGTANQVGQPAAAAAGGEEGAKLIASKPCVGCHTIPGVPGANGTVGPNLAGVASRKTIAGGAVPNNGPDDLKKWILNPPGVKPGTAMPNVGLTEDEATKIVAYLETLK